METHEYDDVRRNRAESGNAYLQFINEGTLSVGLYELAASAGMPFAPDLCILNYYDAEGRMGLHQDKDESARSLEAGLPVVSVSLGDTARFLFGGLRRKDPVEARPLESGDAFVFGGPSRLRYHGVSRIVSGTAPRELALAGRFNLTFRQYDVPDSTSLNR